MCLLMCVCVGGGGGGGEGGGGGGGGGGRVKELVTQYTSVLHSDTGESKN